MRLAIVSGCLFLAACAPVGPDYVRPDTPANPAWLEAEIDEFQPSAPKLQEWWTQLGDPVLDSLIDMALANNNNLRIAGLRVLEAQASLNIASGLQYPQAQVVSGDATTVGASESNANTAAGDLRFTQYNLGAGLSWEIDFWGRFRRGIEAADANLLASIASYDEAMVVLIAQVAATYSTILAGEEQLRLAEESAAIQRRSFEIVELLYQNGESSELDALQAETLLLSTEASIPTLRRSVQQARNALSVLVGQPPSDFGSMLDRATSMPRLPAELRVGVPANLLRQRPDVRRAELVAMAQNALVGVSTANLYPSFSLTGYIGLAASGGTDTTRTGDSGIGELFRGESLTYSAGPSFVWPFLTTEDPERHPRPGRAAAAGPDRLSRVRHPGCA